MPHISMYPNLGLAQHTPVPIIGSSWRHVPVTCSYNHPGCGDGEERCLALLSQGDR